MLAEHRRFLTNIVKQCHAVSDILLDEHVLFRDKRALLEAFKDQKQYINLVAILKEAVTEPYVGRVRNAFNNLYLPLENSTEGVLYKAYYLSVISCYASQAIQK